MRRSIQLISFWAEIIILLLGGYSTDNPSQPKIGDLTDIDGNVYKAVTIGSQVWIAENLQVTHYRNGDALPNITGGLQWSNLTTAFKNVVAF